MNWPLSHKGAFVSAAAADFTGSEKVDVGVIDGNTTRLYGGSAPVDELPIDSTTTALVLVNDGQGNFAANSELLPRLITDFTDVEALDLDGNGRPDIVLLGAVRGWGQPSVVLLNDGTGSIAKVRPIVLPRASLGNSAAHDVVFIHKALFVSPDGTLDPRRARRPADRLAQP